MMKDRFYITEMNICTLSLNERGLVDINEVYPNRYCVVDLEQQIVIDILDELKYDYVDCMNGIYPSTNLLKHIKENKRIAIFPIQLMFIEDYYLKKGKEIINRLCSECKFINGNDIYNNEEYLKHVKEQKKINIEGYNTKKNKIFQKKVKK